MISRRRFLRFTLVGSVGLSGCTRSPPDPPGAGARINSVSITNNHNEKHEFTVTILKGEDVSFQETFALDPRTGTSVPDPVSGRGDYTIEVSSADETVRAPVTELADERDDSCVLPVIRTDQIGGLFLEVRSYDEC